MLAEYSIYREELCFHPSKEVSEAESGAAEFVTKTGFHPSKEVSEVSSPLIKYTDSECFHPSKEVSEGRTPAMLWQHNSEFPSL